MRAVIGEVFRYAIATGKAENDPTFALRGALTTPVTKHRAAIVEPVPFGALLRAVDTYEGSPEVIAALQVLALTFVRPGGRDKFDPQGLCAGRFLGRAGQDDDDWAHRLDAMRRAGKWCTCALRLPDKVTPILEIHEF